MKYETHKRYGQVVGIGMIPLVANTRLMDVQVSMEGFNGWSLTILGLLFLSFLGYKASVFGSGFPDLDCPGSTPARKHKVLAFIFRMFGIKHRGKFSHDVVTQTLLWGLMFVGVGLWTAPMELGGLEAFAVQAVQVMILFTYGGVLSHLLGDALTVDGIWFGWTFKIRLMPVAIRRVGIGSFKPFKSWFTTESHWNHINYKAMTMLLPVVSIVSLVVTVQTVLA